MLNLLFTAGLMNFFVVVEEFGSGDRNYLFQIHVGCLFQSQRQSKNYPGPQKIKE
jgi:hypothetical protein